jgi:hypothetical protein
MNEERMTKTKHVEVYLDRGGKRYRYRLLSVRGENLSNPGQSYASRGGARRAARREHPGFPIVSK